MSVATEILIAVGSALGVLLIGIWRNRADVKVMKKALFGFEGENGGHSDDIKAISTRLDEIENKIDDNRVTQVSHRKDVESEIRANRYFISHGFDKIASEINAQSDDIDIKPPDIDRPEDMDLGDEFPRNDD